MYTSILHKYQKLVLIKLKKKPHTYTVYTQHTEIIYQPRKTQVIYSELPKKVLSKSMNSHPFFFMLSPDGIEERYCGESEHGDGEFVRVWL